MTHEVWAVGTAYEAYVGRWSRLVAPEFLRWLDVAAGGAWLDVGCGTGALTAAVGIGMVYLPAALIFIGAGAVAVALRIGNKTEIR